MYGALVIDSKEELNKFISDEQIYAHYFGEFEPNNWYTSPFRQEKHGSFRIKFTNGKWKWNDYGKSKYSYDAIDFIRELFGLSYQHALQKVYDEVVKGNTGFIKITKKPSVTQKIPPTVRIRRTLKNWEYEFWELGEFTRKELESYNVFSCVELWSNGHMIHYSKQNDPYFLYLFDKDTKCWKAYRPYAQDNQLKFWGNNVLDHVQGYDLLKYKDDILIITKSYKDVLVLMKLGYEAIAPHSENMFLNPWDIDFLKTKYKHIYVFYDNDTTGVNNCKLFTEDHDLNYVNVPSYLTVGDTIIKDPWDVVTNHDYKLLDSILVDKFIRDGI